MKCVCFLFQILVCYVLYGQSRKYDLHAESIKLYGEDFKSLLLRFRRTPEYMKILMEKMHEMNEGMSLMMQHIQLKYFQKLRKAVQESIMANEKHPERTHKNFRKNDNTSSTIITTTKSPIEKLEEHTSLNSPWSVADRNHYRDMGFKFAGQAIHAIIEQAKSMVSEDNAEEKSTRMIDDHRPVVTTTEHVKIHEVTSEITPDIKAATLPPSHKYRASEDAKHKDVKKTSAKVNSTSKGKDSVDGKTRRNAPNVQRQVYKLKANDAMDFTSELNGEDNKHVKIARRKEVFGQKKYKKGVYEVETPTPFQYDMGLML